MIAGVTSPLAGRCQGRLLVLSLLGVAHAAINNDAPAFELKFNDSASVGPDGEYLFGRDVTPVANNGQRPLELHTAGRRGKFPIHCLIAFSRQSFIGDQCKRL